MAQRRRGLSAPPLYDPNQGSLSLPKRRSQDTSSVVGFGTQRKVTQATLKDDIFICKALLFRDLTPRFKEFVQEFKERLEEAETVLCSEKLLNQLSISKNLVQSHLDTLETAELPTMESLKVLQDIRLQKFLLDYGDYLTIDLERLRTDQCFKSATWNQTAANWGRVVRLLEQRDQEWTPEHDKLKQDLLYAAWEIDCDFELLKFQIKTYAERNRIAHSNLKYLISNYQWNKLAEFMIRDREELPSLIPLSRYSDPREFEKVLDRAQNKFFKVLEPGYFELSEFAMNLRNEQLRKRKEKEGMVERERIRLEKKRTDSERRSRQVSEEIERAKRRREVSGSDSIESVTKQKGLTNDALDQVGEQLTLWEISHIEENHSKKLTTTPVLQAYRI